MSYWNNLSHYDKYYWYGSHFIIKTMFINQVIYFGWTAIYVKKAH